MKIRARDKRFRLSDLDMNKSISGKQYWAELQKQQQRLQRIQQSYLQSGDAAAIVLEGWDAGGKGGTIRRISAVLDPRGFKVWPIGAPRRRDAERHYLARFWQRLPPRGGISASRRGM